MDWLPYAALIAGILPLFFMSVGYFFLVRRKRREEQERQKPQQQ